MGRLFAAALPLFLLLGCAPQYNNLPSAESPPAPSIGPNARLAPIRLSNVVVNVRRGTVIGEFLGGMYACLPREPLEWGGSKGALDPRHFSDLFHDQLSSMGYHLVGDPSRLFREARTEPKATYVVGARIDKIQMELCQGFYYSGALLLPYSNGQMRGKALLDVTWQLYDPVTERVVYETTTQGSATRAQESSEGDSELILDSFGNAAANLGADPEFLKRLSAPQTVPVAARTGSQLGPAIRFQPVAAYSTPITDQMDDIRLGVVTLSAGNSHGSGFFISPRLILTNHHVVAGRNVIRVTLLTGRSFLGEVVRTHPARDIALVSVESGGHRPLPLRTAPLKVGDNVYAIGTPLMQQLSGTVTRGIVSAFRTSAKGFEDIQADVDIHGGNSGGPLLDDKGNVVGVTYAGHGGAETSVGLNLFIPINDALRMLNLAPDDPVTGRPTAGR